MNVNKLGKKRDVVLSKTSFYKFWKLKQMTALFFIYKIIILTLSFQQTDYILQNVFLGALAQEFVYLSGTSIKI